MQHVIKISKLSANIKLFVVINRTHLRFKLIVKFVNGQIFQKCRKKGRKNNFQWKVMRHFSFEANFFFNDFLFNNSGQQLMIMKCLVFQVKRYAIPIGKMKKWFWSNPCAVSNRWQFRFLTPECRYSFRSFYAWNKHLWICD